MVIAINQVQKRCRWLTLLVKGGVLERKQSQRFDRQGALV